jgi:hypothetical protein
MAGVGSTASPCRENVGFGVTLYHGGGGGGNQGGGSHENGELHDKRSGLVRCNLSLAGLLLLRVHKSSKYMFKYNSVLFFQTLYSTDDA